MIEIAQGIALEDQEVQFIFQHSSGPGGQNINKVATSVQLRFDAVGSPSLPEEIKNRLRSVAGRRMTQDGILIIEARRFRTQEQNRQDALQRLAALIEKALAKPALRRPTRPSHAARAARVEAKKQHSLVKQRRSKNPADWE